jgi:hypothetical protein
LGYSQEDGNKRAEMMAELHNQINIHPDILHMDEFYATM